MLRLFFALEIFLLSKIPREVLGAVWQCVWQETCQIDVAASFPLPFLSYDWRPSSRDVKVLTRGSLCCARGGSWKVHVTELCFHVLLYGYSSDVVSLYRACLSRQYAIHGSDLFVHVFDWNQFMPSIPPEIWAAFQGSGCRCLHVCPRSLAASPNLVWSSQWRVEVRISSNSRSLTLVCKYQTLFLFTYLPVAISSLFTL